MNTTSLMAASSACKNYPMLLKVICTLTFIATLATMNKIDAMPIPAEC